MNQSANPYHSSQVMTASAEQILLMLYDGAIRFVRQAGQAIRDNRKGDKAVAIGRAMAIVSEFSNTLDYRVGGTLAEDLGRLYAFILRELAAVNAHGDERRLQPVENILLELREGFAGAVQSERGAAPAQGTADSAAQRVAATF